MSHKQAAIRYSVASQTFTTMSVITDVTALVIQGSSSAKVLVVVAQTANHTMLGLVTWGARSTNCHPRWQHVPCVSVVVGCSGVLATSEESEEVQRLAGI